MDRSRNFSAKYDECARKFGRDGLIPMWIADMDFEVAPAITERLKKMAQQGAFGYQFLSEQYYQAVVDWMKRRHQYELGKEEICYVQCRASVIICGSGGFKPRRRDYHPDAGVWPVLRVIEGAAASW